MQLGHTPLASPIRAPRHAAPDLAGSPGISRQALRRVPVLLQPPASPARPLWPAHSVPPTPQSQQVVRERTVATTASMYSSRHGAASSEGSSRDDDAHASTQLILLLTLSVVLLTLPWVVDHPVTLLVPAAFFILPFTSGALRSMCYEGFTLISGGLRWFWRHRKAALKPQTTSAAGYQAPAAAAAAWHQPVQPQTHSPERGYPKHQHQPPRTAPRPMDRRSSQPMPLGMAPPPGVACEQPPMCEWHPPAVRAQPAPAHMPSVAPPHAFCCAAPTVSSHHLSGSAADFTTPDLDFTDSETEDVGFMQAGAQMPPVAAAQDQRYHPGVQACDTAYELRRNADPSECTVYNWDAAEECTNRRGHRPLSELLSNGQ